MKKYLFRLFAIALAISFSAFTKPAKRPFAPVDLQFTGFLQSEASVENESLWREGICVADCTDDKACKITVDASSLSGTAPYRFLNATSVQIDAVQGGDEGYYKVSSLSGSGACSASFCNSD